MQDLVEGLALTPRGSGASFLLRGWSRKVVVALASPQRCLQPPLAACVPTEKGRTGFYWCRAGREPSIRAQASRFSPIPYLPPLDSCKPQLLPPAGKQQLAVVQSSPQHSRISARVADPLNTPTGHTGRCWELGDQNQVWPHVKAVTMLDEAFHLFTPCLQPEELQKPAWIKELGTKHPQGPLPKRPELLTGTGGDADVSVAQWPPVLLPFCHQF